MTLLQFKSKIDELVKLGWGEVQVTTLASDKEESAFVGVVNVECVDTSGRGTMLIILNTFVPLQVKE